MRRGTAAAVAVLALGLGLWATPAWRGPAPAQIPPADRPMGALPAEGPLRITAFGTSLTARASWPDALAGRLSDCLGREVAVTRVARPGASVEWGLGQVGAVRETEPHGVLVEFAINDADLTDGLSPGRAMAAHRELVAELRAGQPDLPVALMTMSPAAGPRGLVRPRLARHYADYAVLAEEEGTGLVDLAARWRALPRGDRGLADGLHPEDTVATSVIVEPLAAYLAAAAGGSCAPS